MRGGGISITPVSSVDVLSALKKTDRIVLPIGKGTIKVAAQAKQTPPPVSTRATYVDNGPFMSRSIFIAKGTNASELACAVVYQKDQELETDEMPWYAVTDPSYCGPKAQELVANHLKDGWRCLVR